MDVNAAAANEEQAGQELRLRGPGPLWSRVFAGLGGVIGVATVFVAASLMFAIASQWRGGLFSALLVFGVSGWLGAVWVHEAGHWAMARWRRAIVVSAMVPTLFGGGWALQPRRRGLRLRLAKLPQGLHGYVMAFPDPRRNVRADRLWFTAGGSLANLTAGALFLLAAWWLGRSSAQAVWMFWAVVQLGIGLLNLIPRRNKLGVDNDGLTLCRLWLNPIESLPGAALLEALGWQSLGRSRSQWPSGLESRLAREPAPAAAILATCELLEAIAKQDEARARQAMAELDRQAAQDVGEGSGVRSLRRLAEVDWVVYLALRHGDAEYAEAIDALDFSDPIFWWVPHAEPRLRALSAALRGDGETMRTWLARSKRYADNDADPRVIAAEATCRERIGELIERVRGRDGAPRLEPYS